MILHPYPYPPSPAGQVALMCTFTSIAFMCLLPSLLMACPQRPFAGLSAYVCLPSPHPTPTLPVFILCPLSFARFVSFSLGINFTFPYNHSLSITPQPPPPSPPWQYDPIASPHASRVLPRNQLSLSATCNLNCSCAADIYVPVCGSDGYTYASPCFAGCRTVNNGYGMGLDGGQCVDGARGRRYGE